MNRSLSRVLFALCCAAVASALGVAACSHVAKEGGVETGGTSAAGSRTAASRALPNVTATAAQAATFETIRAVLQHPRCLNCHPSGDAPLQGDDSHVHQQNILRGAQGGGVAGLSCNSCHGRSNPPDSYGPHTPPGVSTGWRLPPPEMKMVFVGLSSPELCAQLRDPQRTGGKDLGAMVDHVTTHPLVLWGWDPGFGRKPVPIPHAEFAAAFKSWADAGAPCPVALASAK